jgi:hypothetical protein
MSSESLFSWNRGIAAETIFSSTNFYEGAKRNLRLSGGRPNPLWLYDRVSAVGLKTILFELQMHLWHKAVLMLHYEHAVSSREITIMA